MPETKTYSGGCHGGKVRYETRTDLAQVIACNCSICTKHGLMWTFVTPDRFTPRSAHGGLSEYRFGKKTIHHFFCPQCGVESFARGRMPDGREMVAINVRCLDGVDVTKLTPTPFDGRSL